MEKAILKKCTGEAHNNPFIDNCSICMPFWEVYPVCPKHNRKLLNSGYCRDCKRYYDTQKV